VPSPAASSFRAACHRCFVASFGSAFQCSRPSTLKFAQCSRTRSLAVPIKGLDVLARGTVGRSIDGDALGEIRGTYAKRVVEAIGLAASPFRHMN
jgi:hypothetical protein